MRRASALLLLSLAATSLACAGGDTAPGVTNADQVQFGIEMAQMGLWEEARFRFRQAEAGDPSNFEIVNNMAVAAEALGQYEEAAELYRRALSLNPGDPELRNNHDRFLGFWQAYSVHDVNALPASAPEDAATVEEDGDGSAGGEDGPNG